jgi:Flp pilus assembly protein TadD
MPSQPLRLLVYLFLIMLPLAVFWQVQNYDFVNYDDDQYVTENRQVQAGLTWKGVIWAFTTNHASNWHPLTWLSHMLDCQIYGLKPSGHHLTSILFHIVNTLLLFLLLERMTGAFWQSSLVAALFALHPLHVESVAWVAERKDVLSTFFWMLTMWAYVRYVESPGYTRYLLTLLCFALGLMAKPMLVTLPFVLVLIDYWPLGRFRLSGSGDIINRETRRPQHSYSEKSLLPVLKEKVPFFALAVVSSVVTLFAQQRGGAIRSLEVLPFNIRVTNAVISYASYIGKMIWPHKLAVLYPLSQSVPISQVLGAGLFLLCVSVFVILARQRFPYLIVGWLWYLGTLVPVIGLVQVGVQSMADRYTYIPLIGLFIMIAWSVPELVKRWGHRRHMLAVLTGMLLTALVIRTWLQARHWKNSFSLFKHTVSITADNWVAHNNLGAALDQQGRRKEAISHYYEALRIKPHYVEAHNNLGLALANQGSIKEAIGHFSEALKIRSDYAKAHNNLGLALANQGRPLDALDHFSKALQIEPNMAEAHNNLAVALMRQGRIKEAISHFSRALKIKPSYANAHYNLGLALAEQGRVEEAIHHYSQALQIKPDFTSARKKLTHALQKADQAAEPSNTVMQP